MLMGHMPPCIPASGPPCPVAAVIFDLDGVLVSTEELHFQAWRHLASELGIDLDRHAAGWRKAGGHRHGLEMVLALGGRTCTEAESIELAERKDGYYRELLSSLSPLDVLPGVEPVLTGLAQAGTAMAVGSSSRNARSILDRIGLLDRFTVVADGSEISRPKPDPEVFLLAASRLGVDPARCVVVEDSPIGIAAALAAGMRVVALGEARDCPGAMRRASGLEALAARQILCADPDPSGQ